MYPWGILSDLNISAKLEKKIFVNSLTLIVLAVRLNCSQITSDSQREREKPVPTHGLLFPISSKGSYICTIPHTGNHIPWPLLHQSWSTGWNEKYVNGSTMKDRSDDPWHHERTLLPRSCISLRHVNTFAYPKDKHKHVNLHF